MSKINEQVPSTILPIEEEYNYCMYCPMMCANTYMLQDQMMREYNFEDEKEYRPEPGTGVDHTPVHPGAAPVHQAPAPVHHVPAPTPVHPGPGIQHMPVHPGHMIWHGHGGYYGNKYYNDINYFYYLKSRYHLYYPYDPYFDYYNNTY